MVDSVGSVKFRKSTREPVNCEIKPEYVRQFLFPSQWTLNAIFRVKPGDKETIKFFKDTQGELLILSFRIKNGKQIDGMFLMEDVQFKEDTDVPFINIAIKMQYKP